MKAWRDIEKRYKILFYLAIIVIYFFYIEIFYYLGYECTPVKPSPTMKVCSYGFGHDIVKYTTYSLFFLFIVLSYFTRSKFDGMMIGLTIMTPWVLREVVHPKSYSGPTGEMTITPVGIFVLGLLFIILFAAVGATFGFIGSKRKNKAT